MDISSAELKKRINEGDAPIMIDVREPYEWDRQALDGVEKISLSTLPAKLPDLQDWKDKEVVLICRSGGRSGQATQYLKSQGFENARNLTGGMLGWKAAVDPTFDVD